MSLDDAFWNFARDVKRYTLNIIDLAEVNNSAKNFIKVLETTDYIQRIAFKDLHYENLVKIKFQLITRSRSIHDKIFVKLLNFEKAPTLKITKYFDEFLKGITYFSSESPPNKSPAYHRLSSCGSGTQAFRQAYNQCNASMKKNKIAKVKKQIETCYIERLIYDDLYKQQTLFFPTSPSQDKGHVNWLKQTKKDFETCFPDVEIKVCIEEFHNNTSIPLVLRICKKKGSHDIEEVYERSLNNDKEYDPLVVARLYKSNNLIKIKVQMFDKRRKWEAPPI